MRYKEPYCDECGSSEFEIVSTDKPSEPLPVKASDFFHPDPIVESIPAIMTYSHYKATCKKCGKVYRYTR